MQGQKGLQGDRVQAGRWGTFTSYCHHCQLGCQDIKLGMEGLMGNRGGNSGVILGGGAAIQKSFHLAGSDVGQRG